MDTTNDPLDISEADIVEEDFSTEELEDDSTDWKAKALELKGIAKRRATQLAKAKAAKKAEPAPKQETPETPPAKSTDLDYGQKAFLKAYGISGSDELTLVKTWLNRTGDELDVAIEDEVFQAKLQGLRNAKASKEALPSTSKRAANITSDKVEYWIAKGELPPNTPENRQLRQDVVKAKTAKATSGNMFTDNPVVS